MKRKIEEIECAIGNLSPQSLALLDDDCEIGESVKERIYQKTLRRAGIREKAVKKTPFAVFQKKISLRKPIMAAAAILLAISIGTGAIVGAAKLYKRFGQFFKTLPEENYQGIIFDIDQTQSSGGVTVTLTQGMCDGYVLYVIERVEFDHSVAVLTDEMFECIDGSYNAPYWFDEVVVNPDYPRYCASSRNYCKLLEHDAHSMTWLRTFGTTGAGSEIFGFFTIGSKFILNAHDLYNMPGGGMHECSFSFAFDVTRCDPVVYDLPPETYTYDKAFVEDCFDIIPPLIYDGLPDVWINPWFMEIVPASQSGKILNTSLKADKPALVITLDNGKQYTDQDGIGWAGHSTLTNDLFGAGYNKYERLYLTFDEEIDVTSIKSITLYGYELKKASLPDSIYGGSVKQELDAAYPVEVSGKTRTAGVTEIKETGEGYREFPAGSLQYRVKSIGVYDDLYAAGAGSGDIMCDPTGYLISYFEYFDENKELQTKAFTDAFDIQSGRLGDGFYLVDYEIELTNIDSYLSSFDCTIFRLQVYCDYSDEYGKSDKLILVPLAYILADDPGTTGNGIFTLEKGTTRTLHVGFIVNDNHRGSLSQIGLSVGSEFEDDPDFVNITKAAERLNG